MTLINKPEILVDQKALTGEGPSWDAQHEVLYWVDIPRATIYVYNPATRQNQGIDLGKDFSSIGAVVACKSGGLLFTPERKIAYFDFEQPTYQILAEVEEDLPGNRFNDGKCDPYGRFLAGTMQSAPDGTPTGSLYIMDRDTKVRKLLDGLVISNGLGWSTDYRTFYLADSFSKDVWAFDYDLEHGNISRQRTAFTLPDGIWAADGLTTDTDGMLWLALWDGACVQRWDPRSGELLATYPFPAKRTSCPVFGGGDMNELYVTSAAIGLQDSDWQAYPHNGALMRLETEFTGLPSFLFGD
ncbi:MAG: SMP-30/gluconolaconase/LRE domain protein [Chloroflexi bacterium HGW-Chloroflexi-3]|nr:MAG: SMP-30/gluconolaconase/LRE domain protein [Chloroflexi bacterium HGW-Chloroflexi-3]